MSRTKWTDERVEDLAKVVYHNDGELAAMAKVTERLQYDLEQMKGRESMHQRSRFEQAAILAALASPLVTLVIDLVHHAH